MREGDLLTGEPSSSTDERRAQLIAAAEAARIWVRERRATWSDLATNVAVEATPATSPLTDAPPPAQEAVSLVVEYRTSGEGDTPAIREDGARGQVNAVTRLVSGITALVRGLAARLPDILGRPPSFAGHSRSRELRRGLAVAVAKASHAVPVGSIAGPGATPDFHRGRLGETLARWSRRLTVAAAILAILSGVGWKARSYWRQRAAVPKTGTAVLESSPNGSEVSVDGILVGRTPASRELSPGRHLLEFRSRNATRTLSIDITAGRATVERLDWNAKGTGRLQIASEPTGARVVIDGRARGVTPLILDQMTEGSHVVVLESAKGSVRRTVVITADQTAQISESIYAGWVHVSSPIELAISEATQTLRLDDRNLIMLSPGSHALQMENQSLGYRETRQVDIKPGELTRISIVPVPSTLTVTATSAADVMIDGERVGETPLTNHPVKLGTRDVVVKPASGLERRFTVTMTVAPVRLDVDFSRP